MKTQLYATCVTYDFRSLFAKKGYAFFTEGNYNLNIIGVRNTSTNKVTNKFNDLLIVDYNTDRCHKRQLFNITTMPGLYYMNKPINSKGCAILVPGQYRGAFKFGKHKGKYRALCQYKPLPVYRDNNKDDIFDLNPETIDNGNFGINIHRSNEFAVSTNVDKWSAGCQVFASPKEYGTFIRLIEASIPIYGDRFTYTLLNDTELV